MRDLVQRNASKEIVALYLAQKRSMNSWELFIVLNKNVDIDPKNWKQWFK